ncbi:anthranilate synthase component I family protein [Peribacillus sp. SCS-37]|uniref:anthranilate synthase component I family protein n=1 Tax=Paraperibacillus esterisolvens TaxID=3115296 RepID=UPI003905FBA8
MNLKTKSNKVFTKKLPAMDLIAAFERLGGNNKAILEFPDYAGGTETIVGFTPYMEIQAKGSRITVHKDGEKHSFTGNPLEELKRIAASLPPEFGKHGRAIGYFGYDFIRNYEEIGEELQDSLSAPDMCFLFHSEYIVRASDGTAACYLLNYDGSLTPEAAEARMSELEQMLKEPQQPRKTEDFKFTGFLSEMGQEDYMAGVLKIKDHILAGDIFQGVLSQRLKSGYSGRPYEFFKKLRSFNKSQYRFFIELEDLQIAGSSPERLVTIREEKALSNPIAGTRPRGKTETEDLSLEQELKQDEKERAEHFMLVDLARNDLGKISRPGTVHVTKLMEIQKYVNVMHLVSDVEGVLDPGVHFLDAVPAALPAGTVSGAPKIKAMQIINNLETTKRGIYGGGIGTFTLDGSLDLALAIRTMIFSGSSAYLQAGAGIVHDSDPEAEWNETLFKAKGLMEAAK